MASVHNDKTAPESVSGALLFQVNSFVDGTHHRQRVYASSIDAAFDHAPVCRIDLNCGRPEDRGQAPDPKHDSRAAAACANQARKS